MGGKKGGQEGLAARMGSLLSAPVQKGDLAIKRSELEARKSELAAKRSDLVKRLSDLLHTDQEEPVAAAAAASAAATVAGDTGGSGGTARNTKVTSSGAHQARQHHDGLRASVGNILGREDAHIGKG
jgi:hypothetical protein